MKKGSGGGMKSFIKYEGFIFLFTGIGKIRSHSTMQYNLLFFVVVVVMDKSVEANVS